MDTALKAVGHRHQDQSDSGVDVGHTQQGKWLLLTALTQRMNRMQRL